MKVAKAINEVSVTEFFDGVATDGVVNISNTVTIKTDYATLRIEVSSDGLTIYQDDEVVHEF